MQVKRYKAADMRRALELVRSDLGEDAVILSSNNGRKGVEILATADDCQQLLDSANSPEPTAEEKINVFAKYESAAEQEGLAMLDDLSSTANRSSVSDEQQRELVKAASADKSYLAEQLEKLAAQVSFPNKTGGISRKPHVVKAERSRSLSRNGFNGRSSNKLMTESAKASATASIEVVEDSDFSQSFRVASQQATRSYGEMAGDDYFVEDEYSAIESPVRSKTRDQIRAELEAERAEAALAKEQRAKAEQAKVEQAKAEHIKAQLAAEKALEEQIRKDLEREEQARVEQARAEQAQLEQARLNQGNPPHALVDAPNQPVAQPAADELTSAAQAAMAIVEPVPAVATVSPVKQDDRSQAQIDMLKSELSDMRELLELQLTQTRFANLKGMQLACDRKLEQMGFGLHFRSEFHNQCDLSRVRKQDRAWKRTMDYVIERVKTVGCDLASSGGQIAFVGPTGAGKTTTIAKLATRYVLNNGRESIALVTVDNERLGSQSQLKSLAKILQIPLRSVACADDLPETLASLDYCRLVLIDTPGVSAAGINSDPFIQRLFDMPQVTKLAVLACNAQQRFQKSLLDALAGKHVRAAVLTKMDETDCLAETLDVVLTAKMPVAYTTDGQRIPNDIDIAEAQPLVTMAEAIVAKPEVESNASSDAGTLQKQSA
ncbi:DEAD/DEAH box helicase family protein [Halioxenophilus aromaticivorans]|uniref:Flagellar biosynthesis protein FlhF n=1 Tax=Halioxenophilus aromaticivorans TaxID=1306992 RepID=A0AAV3U0D9_9ALTE